MPINAHPDYIAAEGKYLHAETDSERLKYLEEMLRTAPKHKGAENLLKQLKTRRKKLLEKLSKGQKSGKKGSSRETIKKEDMQAVIIGKTNTGKSTLLSLLTNTQSPIAEYQFTTKNSQQGMFEYKNAQVQIQLVESPAIESEYIDKNVINSADTLILIITKIEDISEIEKKVNNQKAKRIIIFNKSDLLNSTEKRKISATLQSKKYNFVLFSNKTQENLEELQEKLFKSFNKIRVYTKEPGKELSEKSQRPIILRPDAIVRDVAEKILHGKKTESFIKEIKIWGPSSKFGGQRVSLKHKLKDLDVVEFKTK